MNIGIPQKTYTIEPLESPVERAREQAARFLRAAERSRVERRRIIAAARRS